MLYSRRAPSAFRFYEKCQCVRMCMCPFGAFWGPFGHLLASFWGPFGALWDAKMAKLHVMLFGHLGRLIQVAQNSMFR